MAHDIKSFELTLARAIEAAVLARSNLIAALKRSGVRDFDQLEEMQQLFFTRAEFLAKESARDELEAKNNFALAMSLREPTSEEDRERDAAWARIVRAIGEPLTRQERALFAWYETLGRADAIMKAEEGADVAQATAAAKATADVIVRAGACSYGNVIPIRTGDEAQLTNTQLDGHAAETTTAAAILAAKRRRAEID
ncbi:MAG: hypothetical protein P4M05_10095 [Bradyrhizobium sp.]|nr:hypothetical protein [Bradyrhizobium sp.]HXR23785.1 hypothetical protein [Candidatus Binataceae bacterium]